MARHGFDARKLTENLDRLLSGWIERGEQPCVMAQVIRRGEVAYERAFGYADVEAKRPLAPDAIFRIYSMTKVFTSVAMQMLLEEGRARLHDPISRYIPAYGDVKVVEHDDAGHPVLVKPRRPITIRDLFTMASGIPYPSDGEDASLSERAMQALMLRQNADARAGKPWDTIRMATEVAKAPLTFHPGEHWWYGYSIDILGALVEIIGERKLGRFLKDRILEPLDLRDTSFTVPAAKLSRLVTMYTVDEGGRLSPVPREADEGHYYTPQPFESGGGGLVSTAHDVGRFAQMLLGFGQLDGTRLLSRASVERMRMNHLSPQQMKDYNWDSQRGYGYGLAVRTMLDPSMAGYGSIGEFAWDGMAGTWFSVDPAEQMTCVLLVQTNPGRHAEYVPRFAQTVYGAIAD